MNWIELNLHLLKGIFVLLSLLWLKSHVKRNSSVPGFEIFVKQVLFDVKTNAKLSILFLTHIAKYCFLTHIAKTDFYKSEIHGFFTFIFFSVKTHLVRVPNLEHRIVKNHDPKINCQNITLNCLTPSLMPLSMVET